MTRRLIASHALSAVAMATPWPVLVAATWASDPELVGAVGAARMLPYVVLSWLVGGLGDRWGRLRVARVSTWARFVALAAVAVFLAVGEPLAATVAATLAVSLGTPAFPSMAGLLPSGGPHAERTTGWLVTVEVSAFAVGPALGGLLLGWFGGAPVGWVTLGLAGLGGLLLLGVTEPARSAVDEIPPRLSEGLATVLRNRTVVGAIGAIAVVNGVLGALGVALLVVAERSWASGEDVFGYATAALGFGALLTPLGLRLLSGTLGRSWVNAAVMGLPLLAVALAPTWMLGLVPLVLVGLGATLVECRTTRVLQNAAPARYRSMALAIADTAMVGAALVGAAFGIPVVSAIGTVPLLLGSAALVAVGCIVGLPRLAVSPAPADASALVAEPVAGR